MSVPSGAETLPGKNISPLPTTLCPSADMTPPSIALVDAAAYICTAYKMEGSVQFSMLYVPESVDLHSASTVKEWPDLSHVLSEYHNFADVFNKAKADRLPPYCPYDLKIDLEDGATPPQVLILCTLSLPPSLKCSENSSMRTWLTVLFSHHPTPMEHQSSSLRRRTVPSAFVLIFEVSIKSPRRTATLFRSLPTS